MAPKKKDKGKLSEWFQCSLCDKLVSAHDADVHSKSCEAEHGYVQNKTLYGKIIKAEGILLKDGSLLTKSLRNPNSVIWLAIPAMQICGLSIGQPCIVNRNLIKQVWPYQTQGSSTVAVTAQCLRETGLKEGDIITVESFKPQGYKALLVELKFNESKPHFETPEFSSFISSYLDGKYLTKGMPLNLCYFGLQCQCFVYNVHYEIDSSQSAETPKFNKWQEPLLGIKSPKELPELSEDGDGSFCSASQDLSLSMTSLNISASSLDDTSSAPQTPFKHDYPYLGTPQRGISNSPDLNNKDVIFAEVSSFKTKFTVISTAQERSDVPRISLSDIGGLSAQINELKSRIIRAQQAKSTCCCILLHGPPGTGKTLLIKGLAADLKANTIQLTGTDIWSKLFGEAEANLRKAFQDAQEKALNLIIIDDMDVMCPKRSPNSAGQQEHRLVGTLLSLIDEAAHAEHSNLLVIIGITNKKDDIDPALRRAGRFGCEVEVAVPTMVQRKEILQVLLSKIPHNLSLEDIESVAMNAHGYVGADLTALLNEASLHALSHQGSSQSELGTVPSLQLTLKDLIFAGSFVKPSALREIQLEVTQVKWSDIGGMSEVKMRLREAVELPLSNPEVFKRLGIEPPRGLLMYGPPGCSKTMVARALATESKMNFLAVKGPELFNQYVGESEKAVREVFRKARSAAPSIIFFDEIDAIAAKRGSSSGSGVDDRVLTQLLTEMDGLEFLKDVFIMAATNRPDKIDNALLRPGRFDSLVYVPLPDDSTREEILLKKFTKMHVGEDVNVATLVVLTHDYSGAEIIQVCQEAALSALREDINSHQVLYRHFETALQKVKPQIDPDLIQIYQKFSNTRIK